MTIQNRYDLNPLLYFGAQSMNLTLTDFLVPFTVSLVAPSNRVDLPMVGNRRFSRIIAKHVGLGSGSGSVTYELLINGISSGLSVTLSVTSTQLSGTLSQSIIANEQGISIRATKNGTIVTSPTNIIVGIG